MKFAIALLLGVSLFADTGFLSDATGTRRKAEFTMDATLLATTLTRWEARITNITCPTADGAVAFMFEMGEFSNSTPYFGIGLRKAGSICYVVGINNRDTIVGLESEALIDLAGRTDVLVRYQRDTVGGTFASDALPRMAWQVWNTANAADKTTLSQNANSLNITTVNAWGSFMGPLRVGDGKTSAWPAGASATIAWAKIHSTLLPTSAPPPHACDTANIVNYQFEGGVTDSSGAGRNMTATNASYPSTAAVIVAAPRTFNAPFWTNQLSFRAGYSNQLDASQSYSEELTCGMTYQWAQDDALNAPSVLAWSSRTTSQPTVTGAIFGKYTARLTATSPGGAVGTATLDVGTVATDTNGIVIMASTSASTMLGQQIAFGRSAWPYLDERHKALSNHYGGYLTTTWLPTWRTLKTGTVSITYGTTSLTGVGTLLSTEFSCVASNDVGDFVAIKYPDANIQGGFRYRAAKINSCTATTATLSHNWDGPTVSGVQFGKFTQADSALWQGGGDGVNYYDNVLAHYAKYYRSGDTRYRDFARTLAANWVENPIIDYYGAVAQGGYLFPPPRNKAIHGIMLYALDTGRTEFWDLIYNNVFKNQGDWASGVGAGYELSYGTTLGGSSWVGDRDPREEGYATGQLSMLGLLYPDGLPNAAARKSALTTFVNNMLTNRWSVLKRSDGSQRNYYNSRLLGTAKVTNGNTAVTGTGFTAGTCTFPNRVWFVRGYVNSDQDTVSYTCTYNSPTSITLASNYAGTTETVGSKYWSSELINGPDTLGYMQGIVGRAMNEANQLTGSAFASTHITDTAAWNRTIGYRPASKGLYYIRSAVDCEPDPETVLNSQFCIDQGDNSPQSQREYAAETQGLLAKARLLVPGDSALATYMDTVAGGLYGATGYGGPSTSDGYSGAALIVPNGRYGKYFGFYFGFGAASTMDAARLGGVAATDTRQVKFAFVAPAGTVTTAIEIKAPTAAASSIACSSGTGAKQCDIPVDYRMGNPLHRIVHATATGTTSGDWMVLKTQ